ncbi:MAG TPA: hypothetical protein VGN05_13715, partial [Parvibaculum sp.]
VKARVERELEHLRDIRVIKHIRDLLIESLPVIRGWDYGEPEEQYTCWTVLAEKGGTTGIAYCEKGFGPSHPWGLVSLTTNKDVPASMGMDSSWYQTFLSAYFESAAADLHIWRVFKVDPSGVREPITAESSWEATWNQVYDLRKLDTVSRYDCGHSIV